MKVKETQLFKLLKLLQKIAEFNQSCMKISSVKSPKFKTVCFQAFYIIFFMYVIINPIRFIVTLIHIEQTKPGRLFPYSYILVGRGYVSGFTLLKVFQQSKLKQLIEEFDEINLEDESRKYRYLMLLYSFKAFYATIGITILSNEIIDLMLPYFNTDLWGYFTFPISTNILKY